MSTKKPQPSLGNLSMANLAYFKLSVDFITHSCVLNSMTDVIFSSVYS